MTEKATLRTFEISSNGENWASYCSVEDVEMDKAGPLSAIERLEASSHASTGTRFLAAHPDRPERLLDVHEDRPDGVYSYAFWLNHKFLGQYRAHFAKTPIVAIDVGDNEAKSFLSGIELINPQWAMLTVDTGAIRRSRLAQALGGHFKSIQIPFYFNIRDSVLGFSPAMLPNEDEHALMRRREYTHGGIHPSMASYFQLTLS